MRWPPWSSPRPSSQRTSSSALADLGRSAQRGWRASRGGGARCRSTTGTSATWATSARRLAACSAGSRRPSCSWCGSGSGRWRSTLKAATSASSSVLTRLRSKGSWPCSPAAELFSEVPLAARPLRHELRLLGSAAASSRMRSWLWRRRGSWSRRRLRTRRTWPPLTHPAPPRWPGVSALHKPCARSSQLNSQGCRQIASAWPMRWPAMCSSARDTWPCRGAARSGLMRCGWRTGSWRSAPRTWSRLASASRRSWRGGPRRRPRRRWTRGAGRRASSGGARRLPPRGWRGLAGRGTRGPRRCRGNSAR
mmetsp:Transcript_161746/g.392834  ORF Transcript_161746/g.392834 Transcript_161746/m.392834 type:complete len:308 (+) Transcript_161746:3-926(+)